MKYRHALGAFLSLFILLSSAEYRTVEAQEGYRIEIEVKGSDADTAYLANYLGKKLYYYDTTYVNESGKYVFTGDQEIEPGVYAFVTSGSKHFELLAEENEFSLKTRKEQPVKHMKVKGSPNNEVFYEYMRTLRKEKSKARPIKSRIREAEGKEKKKLEKKLDRIDERVRSYQRKLAEKHDELLVGAIIRSSIPVEEPEVPDSLSKEEAKRYRYQHYKKHYFDNLDLSDERMARTPTLGRKIKSYFKRMVPDDPDSVIAAADRIMKQVDEGTEMYKYVANFITNKYMNSDIMGMDAVFVHMAKNYYFDGKAFWASEKHLQDWKDRVEKIEPLLIGKKAPMISLADTTGQNFKPLSEVDAKYTILYFWDPECGHCQEATPELKKAYDSLRTKGVEVYAVGTPRKNKKWKEYIRENDLNWINVSHTPDMIENPRKYIDRTDEKSLNFHNTYDIYSTPRIFLLDEDKTIVAKKLGVEQVVKYVVRSLNDKDPQKAPSVNKEQEKKGRRGGRR